MDFEFENKLYSCHQTAKTWEDPTKVKKVFSIVPLDDLRAIAQAKYDSSITAGSSHTTPQEEQGIVRDLLILELLNWFKNDFFTWMNSPDCPRCKIPTVAAGNGTPNPMELSGSAGRVELYKCPRSHCGEQVRFPRYNDPAVLLDTRTGRCGEWANCFGLICRAVGYDTRYVYDFTDHVWVEVFSSAIKPRNRWLHCDPCENTCDNPLLYEAGWGKKLTFIIGASVDEIQDVTWRYTHSNNLKQVLTRRNCDERRVVDAIVRARRAIQQNVGSQRKTVLNRRLLEELVDFICPTGDAKVSEQRGRESGSLAWRLARQEIGGDDCSFSTPVQKGYEWQILSGALEGISNDNTKSTFELNYDPVTDVYNSKAEGKIVQVQGWKNGSYAATNIFRKEERDWNMVYLARQENGSNAAGKISWKFTVPDNPGSEGIKIRKVQLIMRSKTFHNSAKIVVKITSDVSGDIILPEACCIDGVWKWDSDGFPGEGSKHCIIECELSGGSGDVAWQHAQLFRTSTKDKSVNVNEPLFRILLSLC